MEALLILLGSLLRKPAVQQRPALWVPCAFCPHFQRVDAIQLHPLHVQSWLHPHVGHLRCLQNCCWWRLEEIKVLPLDQKESPLSPNLSTNMEKPGIKKMAAKQEQMGALPVLRHHGHSMWPTGCSDLSSPPPTRIWKKNWTPEKTIMTAWVEWLPHPAEGISSWGEALSTTGCWHFPRTRIA